MERKEYLKSRREALKKTHKRVELNLSLSDYESFVSLAKSQNNKKVSTLIAEMAILQRDKKTKIPEKFEESLKEINLIIRGIGNNINQIARNSNIYQEVDKKLFFDNLKDLNIKINDFIKGGIK